MNDYPLWQHQLDDVEFCLTHPEVFNTSDPGTGKTAVCIELIRRLGCPALILAPKSILRPAWGDDFDKFAPEIKYAIAVAGKREEAFTQGAQVVITNHDAIIEISKHPEWYVPLTSGVFIADESSAYKHHNRKRSQAAAQVRWPFARSIAMTGTPNANGSLDLWHQLLLVDKGQRLGVRYYKFRSEICEPVRSPRGFMDWNERPGVRDALGMLIADCTIRHRREDCLDLPEHQVIWRRFELNPTHRSAYNEMKRHTILERDNKVVNAVNAAALTTKLLQTAAGSVIDSTGGYLLVDTDRCKLVMDLVEEREHSLVVFNWHHQRDELLKEAAKRKLTVAVIDGSITGPKRDQTVADFQAGKYRCLLVHPKSAGFGLTLTRGIATIHCSPTYDLELFEQVNARIFRGGQTKKTETILVEAVDTIEHDVYEKLQRKQANMHELLELLA